MDFRDDIDQPLLCFQRSAGIGKVNPGACLVEAVSARTSQRINAVDASRLIDLIPAWHQHAGQFDLASLGWQRIDTSNLSVEETVEEIFRRFNDL